jgi:hypothetical protein
MVTIRVEAHEATQAAIINATSEFEALLAEKWADYRANLTDGRFIATERRIEQEMFV